MVRWLSSNLSPNLSPCLSSGNYSLQSLPKAIQEDNQRFWMQNQFPSYCACALAQLWLVGLASPNTECFLVSCSSCWQRTARLRKTCYHSCNTDLVQERKRFWCLVNFGSAVAVTSPFIFIWNEVFDGMGKKLFITQCSLLCSTKLSTIHWSLSKNMTYWQACVLNWNLKTFCNTADLIRRPVLEKGFCSATSDGWAKLGNNVWQDYESIATKVYSQIRRKWNSIL